jgi:hypothetical protein
MRDKLHYLSKESHFSNQNEVKHELNIPTEKTTAGLDQVIMELISCLSTKRPARDKNILVHYYIHIHHITSYDLNGEYTLTQFKPSTKC